METKDIIQKLRKEKGLSQDELAEKVMVTRQAVSRWETGETVPNTETLKLLSNVFDVSINTLLGEPRKLVCQCCGMPLVDELIGKNKDGSLNENYCKWCFADGEFTYSNMDTLIDVCAKHMVGDGFSEEEAREYMKNLLPTLDYWKEYKNIGGASKFDEFKKVLIEEINELHIEGLPVVKELYPLVGSYVNIAYRLPGGENVRFLKNDKTYLGTQVECLFGGERCFGIVGDMEFILIATYEKDGVNPEIILYKHR